MQPSIDLERARHHMIEQQIRPWDVLDARVLETLAQLRRDRFAPPQLAHLAYSDLELPLGEGQCMLQPKVEARLLQELELQPTDDVLEIGAGSGFMAALLARHARWVTTLELRPALVEMAQNNLKRERVFNVTVEQADASKVVEHRQFDAILLSGSVAAAPLTWLARLKPGGRMAAIVGTAPMMQAQLITRGQEARFDTRVLFDTLAPRLEGFGEPSAFRF